MSERSDLEFVNDIREAINRIRTYTSSMTYKEFLKDKKTQDAVVRNIEIIGEATKNISTSIKKKYPDVPWSGMARTRDKIIHFYFGVNYDIVWDVVKDELPNVVKEIRGILKKES
jgi:uncharacterized protein with HEPN domain